jgi:hypothetical protein
MRKIFIFQKNIKKTASRFIISIHNKNCLIIELIIIILILLHFVLLNVYVIKYESSHIIKDQLDE